jgi:hypothetical protein
MQVLNNTEQDVNYNVSWEGGGDCGDLSIGETLDNPDWNTHQSIEFGFYGADMVPISIEVSETDTGKTVTIGLYYE